MTSSDYPFGPLFGTTFAALLSIDHYGGNGISIYANELWHTLSSTMPVFAIATMANETLGVSSSIMSSPVTEVGSCQITDGDLFASRPLMGSKSFVSVALLPYVVYGFYFGRVSVGRLAGYYTHGLPGRTSISQWYRTDTISLASE